MSVNSGSKDTLRKIAGALEKPFVACTHGENVAETRKQNKENVCAGLGKCEVSSLQTIRLGLIFSSLIIRNKIVSICCI